MGSEAWSSATPMADSHICPDSPSLSLANRRHSAALKKLYIAIALCTVFMVAEILGGILSNSLAIITDAVHLLSDIAGFLTSVVAIVVARRTASRNFTFGFQRAQTLGALASIVFVWILTVYLVIEAVDRIKNPEEIDGKIMFFFALFGLAVNVAYLAPGHISPLTCLTFALGHGHDHDHGHQLASTQKSPDSVPSSANTPSAIHRVEDINVRAAMIHVIGDLIQSIGVLIASALIWYNKEWRIADLLCTILFSILVFATTIFISRDIIRILMEGTPKGIVTQDVAASLERLEGVARVHDLHIWTLSPGNIALTVHVVVKADIPLHQHGDLLSQIQQLICLKYNIHHSTVQMETQENLHCKPAYCCT